MKRPKQIPPSIGADRLAGWTDKRMLYIHGFQHYMWYPNCCVQKNIELTEADLLRKEMNKQDPDPGSRITFNHIINKAVANALRHHILFNSKRTWRDTFLVYPHIDIANVVDVAGMATQIVIPDADKLTLRQVAQLSHRLVSTRRVTLEHRMSRLDNIFETLPLFNKLAWAFPFVNRVLRDYSHKGAIEHLESRPGSFLVTNPGTLGVQDCKAMLFFGFRMGCVRVMAIEQKPILKNGKVTFKKVLPTGLDYDQRVSDAPAAARLLNEIQRNLENPRRYCVGPVDESEQDHDRGDA